MKWQRRRDLLEQEVNGEVVVIDVNSGRAYVLNESAAFLLNNLAEAATLDALVLQFCEEYEVEEAQAQNDATEALQKLQDLGLVLEVK